MDNKDNIKTKSDVIKEITEGLKSLVKVNIAQTIVYGTVVSINPLTQTISIRPEINSETDPKDQQYNPIIPDVKFLKFANIEPEINIGDKGLCLIEYDLINKNYPYHKLIYLGKVETIYSKDTDKSKHDNIKMQKFYLSMLELLQVLEKETTTIPQTASKATEILLTLLKRESKTDFIDLPK